MKLPERPGDPTLEAVDQAIVRANPSRERVYYGLSGAGRECARQNWYSFRWVAVEHHDAATHRRFLDGHAGEALMAERLKSVPNVDLRTEGPDGQQFAVKALGGHIRGHLDGAVVGLLQAPKTWHVWEHKQVNEKKFTKLNKLKAKDEKAALENWDQTYFVQAQTYMGLTGMERHYLTVTTPGGRDITSCRTDFQKDKHDKFMEEAADVVLSEVPPPRISEKPEFYLCKWCNFSEHCHGDKTAAVSCRTCMHVDPRDDGTWHCNFHDKKLTNKEQRSGCRDHLFIPELIPWAEFKSHDSDNNTTTYEIPSGKEITNASVNDLTINRFTSKDLQHVDADLVDKDGEFLSAMAVFEPEIVRREKAKKKPAALEPLDDPLPDFV